MVLLPPHTHRLFTILILLFSFIMYLLILIPATGLRQSFYFVKMTNITTISTTVDQVQTETVFGLWGVCTWNTGPIQTVGNGTGGMSCTGDRLAYIPDLTFSDGSTTRLFDNGPRWTPVLHLIVPVLILAALIFALTCHPPSSHYAHQFWTYSTSLSQSLPKLSLILSSANAFLVFVLLILDVGLYTTARDQINSHAIGLGQVAGSNGITEQTRAQLGTNIWLLVFGTVAVLTEFSVLGFWYARRGRKAY